MKMLRQRRAGPTVAVIVVLALWLTTVQYALDAGRQSCKCTTNTADSPENSQTRTEDAKSPLLHDTSTEKDPTQIAGLLIEHQTAIFKPMIHIVESSSSVDDLNAEEDKGTAAPTTPPVRNEGIAEKTTSNTRPDHEVKARKVALIIEYHWDENIPILMRNALQNLSPDWKLQVFSTLDLKSDPNRKAFSEQLMSVPEWKDNRRLIFTPTIPSSLTYKGYSDLIKSLEFWDQVQGDWVLFLQHDAMLCSRSPTKPEDFMEYDYAGAPWLWHPKLLGGNGGFSLRNKTMMVETIKRCPKKVTETNEDHWFALCWDLMLRSTDPSFPIRLPTREKAMSFSVESMFHPTPLGFHKPWLYIKDRKQAQQLVTYCPEICSVITKDREHAEMCRPLQETSTAFPTANEEVRRQSSESVTHTWIPAPRRLHRRRGFRPLM